MLYSEHEVVAESIKKKSENFKIMFLRKLYFNDLILENKYKIDGSRLIAAGRGSTIPVVPNTTKENRAKNRRIRIVILPNLNKFFALLATDQ